MNKALNNGNYKRRRNGYFRQFKNFDEFKRTMSPKDIRKDCLRIMRDIAYGNIDAIEDQEYFCDMCLLTCLKNAAYENWKYNYWTQYGLENSLKSGTVPVEDYKQISDAYNMHVIGVYAYSTMVEYLDIMIKAINDNSPYAIPNILMQLIQQLQPYKNGFNNTFITSK